MRFQSLVLATTLLFSMSSHAENLALEASLSQAAVDSLQEPIFTKQKLSSSTEKFLVITRDYGSGLELREAYIYRQSPTGQWDILAYRKTNSSRVMASLTDDCLKLAAKSGRVLLELPVEASGFRFDSQEH